MATPQVVRIPVSPNVITNDDEKEILLGGITYLGLRIVKGPGYRLTVNGVTTEIYSDYIFKVDEFRDIVKVNTLGIYHSRLFPLIINVFGSDELFSMGSR